MNKDWELKTLGDVCIVERGLTYSKNDTVDYSSNVVLRATNIDLDSHALVFSELKYLRNNFEIRDKYKLKKGSLLVCFSSGSKSHLGKVALVDENYNYSFGGFIGQITPNKSIHSEYLFYSLISNNYKSYIAKLTDGININNLKAKDLKNFVIPTPTLEEQKQIVAKLDQAFAAIDTAKLNVEKNLENAKELFQSKLNEVFTQKGEGWVEKKLIEWCDNHKDDVVDGPFGSNLKRSDYKDDGFTVLKIQNVKPFNINLKKIDFVSEQKYIQLKRHSFVSGDIIMTKLGDPLGASAIVENVEKGLIVADLVRIRANQIDTEFLCYHLNSRITNKFINSQQKGATRPRVKITTVRDLPITAPSIEAQKNIVSELNFFREKTKFLESKYQQELNSLEGLKKSILEKAFNGEL